VKVLDSFYLYYIHLQFTNTIFAVGNLQVHAPPNLFSPRRR